MVGKNDLGAKPDEPKPVFPKKPDEPKLVSPEKPVIIKPQEEKIKKPLVIEPDEVKIKKPPLIDIELHEVKTEKPLVIEPDEVKPVQVKPAMPELKGEPGKKTAGVRKRKDPMAQEESRVVTLMLFLSLIFLAGGMAFLALPILNISLPGWLEPVMDLYRKVPFPE